MDKNLGLGRGLSALMGEEETTVVSAGSTDQVLHLDVESLEAGAFQPRRTFEEDALIELVSSIREKGVLQPLLVRKHPQKDGMYEIVAGERRYRAAKIAGLKEVPVIVKDFDDRTTLEVALIENLQRENLNPLEEAEGYKRLLDEFQYTQEELSKVVGKSRSFVANQMRLLDLPDTLKKMVEARQLTAGHARALLNAKNPEALAHQVITKGLNVRQTEKLAMTEGEKQARKPAQQKETPVYKKDNDIMVLENELSSLLKTQVSIKWTGKGGEVVIAYDGLDKLDLILQRLTTGGPVES